MEHCTAMLMTIHYLFDRLIQVLQSESLILIHWFHDNCMQANSDKFQAIAVGKEHLKKKLILKISDTEIICEEVVKLLGVDIDYKLIFDQHITNLCRKAGQQLNVLKTVSPFLSRLNKLTIFYTFILSNFNYCPLAWHFCSENNSRKLEKFRNIHYGLCMRILILLMKNFWTKQKFLPFMLEDSEQWL